MKCKPWIRHFPPPEFQCFSSQCALHGLRALEKRFLEPYGASRTICKHIEPRLDIAEELLQRVGSSTLGEFPGSSQRGEQQEERPWAWIRAWLGTLAGSARRDLPGSPLHTAIIGDASTDTLKLFWEKKDAQHCPPQPKLHLPNIIPRN